MVLAELSRPRNARIASHNMGLVLEWDDPQNDTENMTYTAEYKGFINSYTAVCRSSAARRCDFTSKLTAFGVYFFRVRAELDGENSAWVQMEAFTMDEHTTLGAPTVVLNSSGTDLEVTIRDPLLLLSDFRTVYPHATYNITYWTDGQRGMAKHMVGEQSRVVLTGLKPWTRYCVEVQVATQRFSKHSQPSSTMCERTTKGNDTPWIVALVTFVVIAVLLGLVVPGVLYCRGIGWVLWPKGKLPEHIKDYLSEPRHSSIFLAMQNSSQSEEIYHQVSLMVPAEEGEPPLVEAGPNCTQADQEGETKGESFKGNDPWQEETGGKGVERTVTGGREEDLLQQPS